MTPASDEGLRPWKDVETPPSVRIPAWLFAALALPVVAGAILGVLTAHAPVPALVRAIFFASAFGYLAVSTLDFWQHFQYEKKLTGKYLASVAIPIGESVNHALTSLVIVLLLVLARPPGALAPRDLYCLAAPGLFLLLGWRDEIVYHRRRATHREDIMHTVSHLGAATMLASFVAMRMIAW